MKTCGCEGSEKAYVIINPDSPDRKQILSLNPPICREIISNSLDIDGEIHIFKKEIQDWEITPLAGEIKVEWSPDDIEIIGGKSWIPSQGNNWAEIIRFKGAGGGPICNSTGRGIGNWQGATMDRRWRAKFYRKVDGTLIRATSAAARLTTPYIDWEGFPIAETGCYKDTTGTSRTIYVRYFTSGGALVSLGFDSCIQCFGWNTLAIELEYSVWTKITSDTGAISIRETTIAPDVSLLAGGCELVVNYLNNTSSGAIKYPQCPQNIRKIESLEISDTGGILEQIIPAPSGEIVISCGERECPPETCFNCDCSELNCCYDENGKLIDSFIRRT